jgi:hypothetical protein
MKSFEKPSLGRKKMIWEDNLKMDHIEISYKVWEVAEPGL